MTRAPAAGVSGARGWLPLSQPSRPAPPLQHNTTKGAGEKTLYPLTAPGPNYAACMEMEYLFNGTANLWGALLEWNGGDPRFTRALEFGNSLTTMVRLQRPRSRAASQGQPCWSLGQAAARY